MGISQAFQALNLSKRWIGVFTLTLIAMSAIRGYISPSVVYYTLSTPQDSRSERFPTEAFSKEALENTNDVLTLNKESLENSDNVLKDSMETFDNDGNVLQNSKETAGNNNSEPNISEDELENDNNVPKSSKDAMEVKEDKSESNSDIAETNNIQSYKDKIVNMNKAAAKTMEEINEKINENKDKEKQEAVYTMHGNLPDYGLNDDLFELNPPMEAQTAKVTSYPRQLNSGKPKQFKPMNSLDKKRITFHDLCIQDLPNRTQQRITNGNCFQIHFKPYSLLT